MRHSRLIAYRLALNAAKLTILLLCKSDFLSSSEFFCVVYRYLNCLWASNSNSTSKIHIPMTIGHTPEQHRFGKEEDTWLHFYFDN